MKKLEDLTGKTFGYWTVLGFSHVRKGERYWHCRCICGVERELVSSRLQCHHTFSCGCHGSTERNLTGKKFGRLTALHRVDKRSNKYWVCRCDCGGKIVACQTHLNSGNVRSCGCLQKEAARRNAPALIDLTGKKFGRWTVLEYVGRRGQNSYWRCRCECGTIKEITGASLRRGLSTSCGCSYIPDLTGKTFGEWTVIRPVHQQGRKMWECRCSCGATRLVATGDFRPRKLARNCRGPAHKRGKEHDIQGKS